jgi:hypothetical protein
MAAHRTNRRLLLPSVWALLVVACASASPEQQLLIDFFQWARLGDHTRLANIATVTFEPNVDGAVDRFSILRLGPAEHRSVNVASDSSDRGFAIVSLTPPGASDVDLTGMGVEAVRKTVVVDAAVRRADGRMTQTELAVTLQRAIGRFGGTTREGRWIVTGVERVSARSG